MAPTACPEAARAWLAPLAVPVEAAGRAVSRARQAPIQPTARVSSAQLAPSPQQTLLPHAGSAQQALSLQQEQPLVRCAVLGLILQLWPLASARIAQWAIIAQPTAASRRHAWLGISVLTPQCSCFVAPPTTASLPLHLHRNAILVSTVPLHQPGLCAQRGATALRAPPRPPHAHLAPSPPRLLQLCVAPA